MKKKVGEAVAERGIDGVSWKAKPIDYCKKRNRVTSFKNHLKNS